MQRKNDAIRSGLQSARRPKLVLAGAGMLALLFALPALARVTDTYNLDWFTVDGGGGTFSTGGTYSLGGTAGQPDAGQLSGWNYGLTGGFWGVAASTPTPQPALLVGHVTWQGRPAQPNTLQQLPITLTLRLTSGGPYFDFATQNTDSSGYFTVTVTGLPAGTYNWRVKGPKYLANAGQVVLSGGPQQSVEMGLMKVGDANNDNVVNTIDFTILKGTFGKALGDPGYDQRADFNGDNRVNVTDFTLQKSNFGLGGAPPLHP